MLCISVAAAAEVVTAVCMHDCAQAAGAAAFVDRSVATSAGCLEEAWARGFDVDVWRAHLGPATWPEVGPEVPRMHAYRFGSAEPSMRAQPATRACCEMICPRMLSLPAVHVIPCPSQASSGLCDLITLCTLLHAGSLGSLVPHTCKPVHAGPQKSLQNMCAGAARVRDRGGAGPAAAGTQRRARGAPEDGHGGRGRRRRRGGWPEAAHAAALPARLCEGGRVAGAHAPALLYFNMSSSMSSLAVQGRGHLLETDLFSSRAVAA